MEDVTKKEAMQEQLSIASGSNTKNGVVCWEWVRHRKRYSVKTFACYEWSRDTLVCSDFGDDLLSTRQAPLLTRQARASTERAKAVKLTTMKNARRYKKEE